MIQDRPEQSPPGSDDKGASAVLIALSMVVLMGFAAISVDAGLAFEDRRQQQSAADVGALAALQFARTGLATTHPDCVGRTGADLAACRGAEEVLDVVEGTLPGRYSDTEWDACLDLSKPLEYVNGQESFISDCITFTETLQKVRVVLPGTDVETAFARVIGFNSIAVSALAEAGLDLNQSAAVLPFALGPTGAASDQACLFVNPTKKLDIDPCDGPVEGNFGKLDMSLYRNTTLGTPQICGNAKPQTKMAVNIVVGSDHHIEENFVTPGTVEDVSNCPIIGNSVDRLNTQTGGAGIEDGLFLNISVPALEGRLRCKDGDASENPDMGKVSSSCVDVTNQFPETVDNTPLWNFINAADASETIPINVCTGGISTRQEMETCLAGWKAYGPHPAASSLFTFGLKTSTRFAAVPILETDPSNGTGGYDVIDFRPVYLSTFYLNCNANTCAVVHSPGEASSGDCPTPTDNSCGWPLFTPSNVAMRALTSYILTLDMLHPDIRENFPAAEGTIIFNLSK